MTASTNTGNAHPDGWRRYFHPRVLAILLLGFSAGLPLLLIFGTLSLWLSEAGVGRATVTYFSWAALGYSFKFVWAPLVDKLPLPFLSGWLGQRRGWLLLAQLAVSLAIVLMALSDPSSQTGLDWMAFAAVFLGFSSATQDIVIDAYRIEAVDRDLQALMASSYVAGYRIGMLVAGAGSLYLADWLGTSAEQYRYGAWMWTYLAMAASMGVGIVTTLVIKEPINRPESAYLHHTSDYLRFVGGFLIFVLSFIAAFNLLTDISDELKEGLLLVAWLPASEALLTPLNAFLSEAFRMLLSLAAALGMAWLSVTVGVVPRAMVRDTYIAPVLDFFERYGRAALLIILLVGFYRVSDIVLGAIANVFYKEMGFSKTDIATATKTFGIWMTIFGGFVGGFLTIRYGVMRILMLGAVLTVATNLLFVLLAQHPGDLPLLYIVIGADNITAGLAVAAFIAYLSSLTSLSFTAVQYAIFSSVMTLFPKLLAGYSGSMVDSVGYTNFFLGASIIGVPVFLLVWLAWRYTEVEA